MDPTLSQAFPASIIRVDPSRKLRTRPWMALLFLAFGLASTACNRVDTNSLSEDGETTSDGRSTGEATEAPAGSADFDWPVGDDHPRLLIEVDDGATGGSIEIELMPELAPLTVLRVADLARNGYYDQTTFHRVIEGFMIQGGDPNSRDRDPGNDGLGGSDVQMDDEFSAAPFERGVVGMANTGRPDSSGGQFFIMHGDQRELDGKYTAIGRVISGMDVVDAIARVETDRSGRWGPKDRPIENVVMSRVRIGEPIAAAVARPQGTADGRSDG